MNPKISVIIPVYNAAPYLDLLLSSIVTQTLKAIEIIVVDDKSTDDSLTIIQRFAAQDSRIRVIEHVTNSGLSVTRNTGMLYATGDYIAFADSDDYMMPETLNKWHRFSERQNLDLMIGNAFRFIESPDESTHLPVLRKQQWQHIKTGSQWIEHAVDVKEWPHFAWLQLIKRDLIRNANITFVEGLIHEDILWTMQVALASVRISFYEEPLYGYRKTPNSIVNKTSNKAKLSRCQSYLTIIDTMGKQAKQYPRGSKIRKALFRQCNQESGHLLGLVRKQITNDDYKTDIARGFFKLKQHKTILAGTSNAAEFCRALKCMYTLRQYL